MFEDILHFSYDHKKRRCYILSVPRQKQKPAGHRVLPQCFRGMQSTYSCISNRPTQPKVYRQSWWSFQRTNPYIGVIRWVCSNIKGKTEWSFGVTERALKSIVQTWQNILWACNQELRDLHPEKRENAHNGGPARRTECRRRMLIETSIIQRRYLGKEKNNERTSHLNCCKCQVVGISPCVSEMIKMETGSI